MVSAWCKEKALSYHRPVFRFFIHFRSVGSQASLAEKTCWFVARVEYVPIVIASAPWAYAGCESLACGSLVHFAGAFIVGLLDGIMLSFTPVPAGLAIAIPGHESSIGLRGAGMVTVGVGADFHFKLFGGLQKILLAVLSYGVGVRKHLCRALENNNRTGIAHFIKSFGGKWKIFANLTAAETGRFLK